MENVDEELALDDVVLVNRNDFKTQTLQGLSFTLPEPMLLTESSSSDEEDESSSSNDETSSSNSDYDDSSEDESDGHPMVKSGQTLREYFQEHFEYWLSINNPNIADESEKERRRLAFEACKTHFESLSLN